MSKLEPRAPFSAPSRTTGALQNAHWIIGVALGMVAVACGSEGEDPNPGTGGTGASGGMVGTGGSTAGKGGTGASGGNGGTPTGGTSGSGGTASSTGGATTGGSAGAATGGSGGTAGAPVTGGAGGAAATGGIGGAAAASGAGGTAPTAGTGPEGGNSGMGGGAAGSASGGAPTGGTAGTGGGAGTGSGTCMKGTTMGDEVLFIGESFVAASSIPEETTKLARAAGSLGANDSYVDKSVSGTWIGNGASNSIPAQYRNNSNGVRFVLMNGGGNDCWQGGQESHRTAALSAARTLFEDMGENGVEKVVYFFYPDPIGGSFANLKACLDLLRPAMKTLCDEQTSPKCYWVDLRETWDGHPEYTGDGIHVADPGNVPTATAIFESMQANCVAP